jgi:hypothetical protein
VYHVGLRVQGLRGWGPRVPPIRLLDLSFRDNNGLGFIPFQEVGPFYVQVLDAGVRTATSWSRTGFSFTVPVSKG